MFKGSCPDCGEREFPCLAPLPDPGDDFDWLVRDYEGFRRFMLDELAARFPERRNWTPADLEVVLVEVLAAVLDQLSDMADRVASEAYLETARRPESVRRLLNLIGYPAIEKAQARGEIETAAQGAQAARLLESFWLRAPHRMEEARRAGPREIHTQYRMVTTGDYALRLKDHPLVLHANSWSEWSGSWSTVRVAVIAWGNTPLDEVPELQERPGKKGYSETLKRDLAQFHKERNLFLPDLGNDGENSPPTIRTILRPYLNAYRMAGKEVILQDAVPVGISMAVSVRVAENYFRSEVRRAVRQALGTGPGGFFEPGRLLFGEDLHASDIVQTLMALEGVENVCLNRFKKVGRQFPDEAVSGTITLEGLEIAVCDNVPDDPSRGYYRLKLNGGRKG